MQATKVILNLGMGVESSAILTRLLLEPQVRDFDLADLMVVTSQTGDEFPDTGALVETHLLPLMKAHGVRYVQVARDGAVKVNGRNVRVLSDGISADRCMIEGGYKLSDELLAAGTVPTTGGDRKCSIKAKGEVIDGWLQAELGNDAVFRQLIGFNADERNRADDDRAAQTKRAARGFLPGRRGEFPLSAWGWTREKCLEYLRSVYGVTWLKSACCYCPYSRGKDEVRERYRANPDAAAFAVWVEHLALALNPRMALFVTRTVREVIEADGNAEAMRLFRERLDACSEWAVYHVRRLYRSAGLADRRVEILATGDHAEMHRELRLLAGPAGVAAEMEAGSLRAWLRRKEAGVAQATEEMLVACPRVPNEKTARGWTEERWEARVGLPVLGDGLAVCA